MTSHIVYRRWGSCTPLTTAPQPFQGDPSLHRVKISASVGVGGVNRPADVLRIQQELNLVPADRGGPTVPLKTDGLFGDNTRKAIIRYQMKQLGTAEGRIDPGGLTNRHLSLDADFHPLQPVEAVRFAVAFIPRVQGALLAASAALQIAELQLTGKSFLAKVGQPELDLLERIFSLSKFPDPLFQVHSLQTLVGHMRAAVARGYSSADAEYTGVFVPNRVLAEDFTALAYTTAGGYYQSGQTVTYDPPIGAVRADKIFLCLQFGDTIIGEQVFAVIHEMAHFCGPDRNNPNAVLDYGYGALGTPAMAGLLPWQRTHNAEHIAHYIWNAAYHEPAPRE